MSDEPLAWAVFPPLDKRADCEYFVFANLYDAEDYLDREYCEDDEIPEIIPLYRKD